MTYKKLAKKMIEQNTQKWISELTGNALIIAHCTRIEIKKEYSTITYEIECWTNNSGGEHVKVIVCGEANEHYGIYNQEIYDAEKCKILWSDSVTKREELGIHRFYI